MDNEIIKDIVYHELTEQEFLIHYLKDPKLAYWTVEDNNIKKFYKHGRLMATIENGVVTNHTSIKNYP